MRTQFGQDFQSIHAGQHDIADNQVRQMSLRQSQSGGTIARLQHLETFENKDIVQIAAEWRVIFDK